MALVVVTVASGGLPVVDVSATMPKLGMPVSEAANGRGLAVTKVAAGGLPVTYSTVADWPSGGGGSFTPASLTGLIGWWDASVTASMSLTGSKIQTIADQSSAGNTLTGGVSGADYNATGFNSRPGMTFVASSRLTKSSFSIGTGNTLTVFATVSLLSGSTDYARIISYTAPGAPHDYGNNGSWLIIREATTSGVDFVRNTLAAGPLSFGYATPHRIIMSLKSDGTGVGYIDGVANTMTGGPLVANWVSAGDLFLGYSLNDSLGAGQFAGAFGEVGIATGYHDATTAAQIDTYLKNKWGL